MPGRHYADTPTKPTPVLEVKEACPQGNWGRLTEKTLQNTNKVQHGMVFSMVIWSPLRPRLFSISAGCGAGMEEVDSVELTTFSISVGSMGSASNLGNSPQ